MLLAEGAPTWLLEHMDPEWAARYEKRFSDFRLRHPRRRNGWNERKRLGRMVGGSREEVYAESSLPWVRELDAIETDAAGWGSKTIMRTRRIPRGALRTNGLPVPGSSLRPTIPKPAPLARGVRTGQGRRVTSRKPV